MKKKILIFAIIMAVLSTLSVSACKKNPVAQTASAYGVVHKQYAGTVTITVSKDGNNYKVDEVKIKEYLPVAEIGKVSTSATGTGENQVTTHTLYGLTLNGDELAADFTLDDSEYFANRIKVGDEVFTLTKMDGIEGEPYVYENETYSDGTTYALYASGSLPTGVKNSYENIEFTKWYIEKMMAGDFYVLKGEDNDIYNVPFTNYGSKTGITKMQWGDKELNGYWMSGGVGQGWLTNISKMETAIKTYGLEVYTGNETKGTEGGYLLGTNITGATLNDYHQYMGIAKKAYDDAKAKF